MRSLWHTSTKSEINEVIAPNIVPMQLKVESKYSMISLGTETLVLNKMVPKKMMDAMIVPYMEGSFELPIKYGYALSGLTENGDKVHVMHPHQDKCIVGADSIFKECKDLPLSRIPLISNMETVIKAIWTCDFTTDQEIIVCGFGNIGSLLAVTLRNYYNLNVKILESNLWRKQKAEELGFELYNNGIDFDIAFNTTANESVLQFCIDNAREEGQIIELSWYGNLKTAINFGGNFHKNRLRLIASQVSKIPIKKRGDFNYYKRKQLAVEILNNDIFDRLITNIIPFDESPKFFDAIRNNKTPNGLIYLIKY